MAAFTVTTAADVVDAGDGVLSLREAVQQANATANRDTIGFAAGLEGQTLGLTQGQLTFSESVAIDGDRDDDGVGVTLSAGGSGRVLLVGPDDVDADLTDLGVADGALLEEGNGAGIAVEGRSELTLVNCVVTGCQVGEFGKNGQYGGGVFVAADAAIRVLDSTISSNRASHSDGGGMACFGRADIAGSVIDGNSGADGGGLFIGAGGSLTLQTSSVTRNSAFDFYGAAGGGLVIEGRATIERSLIAGNSARFGGGLASGGEVTLTGSTIANNRAEYDVGDYTGDGGGLSGSNLTVRACTITGNYSDQYRSSSGGAGISSSSLRIYGSIVVGNFSADGFDDIGLAIDESNGRNLFGSGARGSVPGDRENIEAAQVFAAVDPATGGGRLALNGGPTPTAALRDAADNPALGGAQQVFDDAVDQRGAARPQPGVTLADLGAFELNQKAVSRVASGNNDVLTGTSAADTIAGLAGADFIRGGEGDDRLFGAEGSDTVYGGSGDDFLKGGFGNDWLIGRDGNDSVSYLDERYPVGVTIDLETGGVFRGGETDFLLEVENAEGGIGPDTLRASFEGSRLAGAGGADRLLGRYGDDVLAGGPGNDRLDGDTGRDLADYSAGGAVTIDLGLAADRATQAAEVDLLFGIEGAIGSGSADTLKGDESANLFRGQGGKDTMTGGTGADLYDFDATTHSAVGANRDVVTDFAAGNDDLDFVTIDARTATPVVNDAFTFLAARGAAFTEAGQVRWYQSGGDTFVEANVDANLAPDLQIQLTGLGTLTAADFVL